MQVDQHGGRIEQRSAIGGWTSDLLVRYSDWPHLPQVCRLERFVSPKRSTRRDVAYAVTSRSPADASPQRLLALWPGHWGIENRVHWVRDVTFDEDRSLRRPLPSAHWLGASDHGGSAEPDHQHDPIAWGNQHRRRPAPLRRSPITSSGLDRGGR